MEKIRIKTFLRETFPGLYCTSIDPSQLIDSVSQCWEVPENKELDYDYDAYCQAIANKAVELLNDFVEDSVIESIELVAIDSPRYYNYETDCLILDITYDKERIFENVSKHRALFDAFVKDHFTSYDGYVSFLTNNPEEFLEKARNGEKSYMDVLVEFYIYVMLGNTLTNAMPTQYIEELSSFAFEWLYENAYLQDITM